MVNDVIDATRARIARIGIETAEDVRNAGRIIGGIFGRMAVEERRLKKFMYTNLYHHPVQQQAAEQAQKVVAISTGPIVTTRTCCPKNGAKTCPEEPTIAAISPISSPE